MQQRDLLKEQIEQMGKVIARIMADFLHLKSKGKIALGIEQAENQFQNMLDIDIEKIFLLKEKALAAYLSEKKLTDEHLEILSEYLLEMAEKVQHNKSKAKAIFEKAIELLDIADDLSKTVSFNRINKKSEILNVINAIENS